MKKCLPKFVAIFLLLFNSMIFTSFATEESGLLVLSFPEKKVEVEIPDKYQYVFDEEKTYRGDLEELGLDLDDLRYDFSYTRALCFYAFAFDDKGYQLRADVKAKESDGLTGDLRGWDKDHIELLASQLQGDNAANIGRKNVYIKYKTIYYAESGDPYMVFSLSSGDENYKSSIYCTLIDGWFYYFTVQSYDPDADKEALKADVEELIEHTVYPERTYVAAEETIDGESEDQISEENSLEDDQSKQDTNEKIANMYFLAGKLFAVLVVVAIIISIISVNSSKKKKHNKL